MNKKTNTINVFEIISRINDDFGNLVYSARSFPSVDVKFDGTNEIREINIETSDKSNPEAPRSELKIIWKKTDKIPNYHVYGNSLQTSDGETERFDYFDFNTSDIFKVIEQIKNSIIGDDEPTGDEDADTWESGYYPDDYFEHCRFNRKGIFQGLNAKTTLGMPWF